MDTTRPDSRPDNLPDTLPDTSEASHLLPHDESSDVIESRLPEESSPRTKSVLLRLYISHSLSTWNSRMFEFGSVLFLADIFPGTLLYASIYALVRAFSAVVLSSWLGSMVDRSNRLKAIRQSIIWQRLPVAVSCACFVLLLIPRLQSTEIKSLLFTAVVLLACVEKLAATANTVSVERDWAIVISDALQYPRQELNASMRRIDLFCKLVAPVVISLLAGMSAWVAIWTVLGVNVSCVVVEYIAIAQVYKFVPELDRSYRNVDDGSEDEDEEDLDDENLPQSRRRCSVKQNLRSLAAPWKKYVASRVFLASLSLSLLYLTVLSFGTTMVTYLLHTGFSAVEVSCMRIGAVIAELSGTWAAPVVMNRIGPIRSGLWFLNWQFACLATAVVGFACLEDHPQVVAVSLIVGVALSRLGLWGFDLSVQFLIQEGIEEHARARFSSTEMALQNIFELLSFATTIVFPRPAQFKYPVFISYGAIGLAAAFFAAYVRRERGHLLHTSKCFGGDKVVRREIPV